MPYKLELLCAFWKKRNYLLHDFILCGFNFTVATDSLLLESAILDVLKTFIVKMQNFCNVIG